MKNYLIILLLLIFGITGTYYNPPKSIKYDLLIDKDGLKYDPNRKLTRVQKYKTVKSSIDGKVMNYNYTPVPYNISFNLFINNII